MGSCGLCVQGLLCADVQSLLCVVLVACMLCRSQLLFRGTNTTGAFFGMTALAGTPGGLNNTVIVISQPALTTVPVGATAFRGRIFGGCKGVWGPCSEHGCFFQAWQ
jgi:hypothetical protein